MKTWSLVISFLGDSVLPRGGTVPLSLIVSALKPLGVDGATVRAAVARLTRDGWLVRERRGRSSDYRLDTARWSTFATADARIYSPPEARFGGRWCIAVMHLDAGPQRAALRATLRTHGFGALSHTTFIKPMTDAPTPEMEVDGLSFFEGEYTSGDTPLALLADAFDLPALDTHYGNFIADFEPLQDNVALGDGDMAVALRTVMVHEFRRAVLRDPQLPEGLTHQLHHRIPARTLAARLYRQWLTPSEAWLDTQHSHWLEDPRQHLSTRFCDIL